MKQARVLPFVHTFKLVDSCPNEVVILPLYFVGLYSVSYRQLNLQCTLLVIAS